MRFSNTGQLVIHITIASHTRFHMFDLAHQMIRLKQCVHLYTGYPKWKLQPELKVIADTHPFPVLVNYAFQRIGYRDRQTRLADAVYRNFGRWIAGKTKKCDVFDALAGCGMEAGRQIQNNGGLWLCNCGSSHILFQKATLEEEHARWGASPPFFSARGLIRVLAEYGSADYIVVPSEFARRSFIDQGFPTAKIVKIPYGVDLSLFKPKPKKDRKFRVLFVGHFSIRKGIVYLFEALKPLVKAKLVELWMIGTKDPSTAFLMGKYADIFIYKGVFPRGRLSELYSQGSVLVIPSIEEGLALVQAQAMACGLPVIATTNTGAEDFFSDEVEGFIVPAQDAQAIRERLEYLLAHPYHRAAMGRAALNRVKEFGGWNRYGDDALATYRFLLKKPKGSNDDEKKISSDHNCDPHL